MSCIIEICSFILKRGWNCRKFIEFYGSKWLELYIRFNTEQRKLASTTFEQDFYKLLINSFFGKSMENLRKRVDIRLVTSPEREKRLIARPNFDSFRIVNKDLTMVKMNKVQIYWDKPT